MTEIANLVFSGFWTWLGTFAMLYLVGYFAASVVIWPFYYVRGMFESKADAVYYKWTNQSNEGAKKDEGPDNAVRGTGSTVDHHSAVIRPGMAAAGDSSGPVTHVILKESEARHLVSGWLIQRRWLQLLSKNPELGWGDRTNLNTLLHITEELCLNMLLKLKNPIDAPVITELRRAIAERNRDGINAGRQDVPGSAGSHDAGHATVRPIGTEKPLTWKEALHGTTGTPSPPAEATEGVGIRSTATVGTEQGRNE